MLRFLFALAIIAVSGCERSETAAVGEPTSGDAHQEAVVKFQDGQKRFQDLIATVRDERSFDEAQPGLDRVVSDWKEVTEALRGLEAPSEEAQARFRAMIAEGHRRTEPTGEDMLSLLSIESREAEVTEWLEEFAAAASEVGVEMARLFGPAAEAADSTNGQPQ